MPYTDVFAQVQKRYPEHLSIVMVRLLNRGGWKLVSDEFGVTEQTVGEWMKRCNIVHKCVYVVSEQETEKVEATI